jgi:hypothetical protein
MINPVECSWPCCRQLGWHKFETDQRYCTEHYNKVLRNRDYIIELWERLQYDRAQRQNRQDQSADSRPNA